MMLGGAKCLTNAGIGNDEVEINYKLIIPISGIIDRISSWRPDRHFNGP